MDALKRANDIRTARAKLKKDLKAGKANIHTLLLDPPEYLLPAKVFDMLLAVPKYGREDQQGLESVPDLPVEDHWGALGATARRVGKPAPQVATAAPFSIPAMAKAS